MYNIDSSNFAQLKVRRKRMNGLTAFGMVIVLIALAIITRGVPTEKGVGKTFAPTFTCTTREYPQDEWRVASTTDDAPIVIITPVHDQDRRLLAHVKLGERLKVGDSVVPLSMTCADDQGVHGPNRLFETVTLKK